MDKPHGIAFHSVAILHLADQGNTITSLAEIRNHMGAYLEFSLIQSRVAVCRSLDQPILTPICSIERMYV